MVREFLFGTIVFLISSSAIGASLLSAELDGLRENGFRSLYSLDYAKAKKTFEEMIHIDPHHPAGYIYLGSAFWLEHLASIRRLQTQIYNRGNAFFQRSKDAVNASVEKEFYQWVNKGIIRAEARLRLNQNDVAGLYFLGTAHGAIAGYEATVKRSFLTSLKNGSRATELHRKVLKVAPNFADAYLTLGMYNYVIGTLPMGVKILMFLGGVRGSKKEGLNQIAKARKEGNIALDEASVILAVLYDREKNWNDALPILQELCEKYPQNYVFALEKAAMMSKSGKAADSFQSFDKLLHNNKAVEYMADLIHFHYADALFASGQWEKALDHYLAARRTSDQTPLTIMTLTHLRAGLCLNALGQNEEANVEYSYVLRQPNYADSHELARKYMKKPFRP